MQIINRPPLNETSSLMTHPTVITMGNFDGCHRGHQILLREALRFQKTQGLNALALSFSPRSKVYFKKDPPSQDLFTEEQKSRVFEELGFDAHVIEEFHEALCQTPHEIYYLQRLVQNLNMKALVIGEDFCFGARRKGTSQWLKQITEEEGRFCTVLPRQIIEDQSPETLPLRSSSIRRLLQEGDVALAAKFLGRPYLLEGMVQQGQQLGRELGFPTINLTDLHQLLPKYGVYAGWIWIEEDAKKHPSILDPANQNLWPAVFNIGIRPTLREHSPRPVAEGHVLAGSFAASDLYGKRVGFYLAHNIRDEKKFATLEELKEQIPKDKKLALSKL